MSNITTEIKTAQQGARISDLTTEAIGLKMIEIFQLMGLPDNQYAEQILMKFIKDNYGSWTIDQIYQAHVFAMKGIIKAENQKEPLLGTFGKKYNAEILARVLNFYATFCFRTLKEEKQQVHTKEKEVKALPPIESYHMVVAETNKYNRLPFAWNWANAYHGAVELGLIVLSDADKMSEIQRTKNDLLEEIKSLEQLKQDSKTPRDILNSTTLLHNETKKRLLQMHLTEYHIKKENKV